MFDFNRQISVVLPLILFLTVAGVATVSAQSSELQIEDDSIFKEKQKSPSAAFVRSIVLPGWGHFYAGKQHRTRGGIHLGAEGVLIGSIFGFNMRANRIENDFITFANLNAGVDLSSRDRSFRLAVADFNSLDDYNDYQLRTRNWNRLIEDIPDNRWSWQDSDARNRYSEMRSDSDRIRNQIPALAGIMVVNRVISAISAYNRVRNENESNTQSRAEVAIVPVMNEYGSDQLFSEISGVAAKINIRF
jgi:cation transport regulator ChaB